MSAADRLAVVELRDSRAYPAPWWRWLLVDTATNQIDGYFKRRRDADIALERRIALEDGA